MCCVVQMRWAGNKQFCNETNLLDSMVFYWIYQRKLFMRPTKFLSTRITHIKIDLANQPTNQPTISSIHPMHAIFQIAYYDIYQYISKTEPNNLFGTSRCYFQSRSINEVFFLWQASVQSLQSVYVVIRRDEKKECLWPSFVRLNSIRLIRIFVMHWIIWAIIWAETETTVVQLRACVAFWYPCILVS